MIIENIDEAKRLNDAIKKLNRILALESVNSIYIQLHSIHGVTYDCEFREEDFINGVKTELINEKNRLENKLNKLL